jgi:O-antigen ligase
VETNYVGRAISPEQLASNFESLFVEKNEGELEGTRRWRVEWWKQIVDYTVFGEHFWNGKGYGVNLADEDGFQVAEDHSLRAPHNAHLTILARSGVPGFTLWVALQVAFAGSLVRAHLRARRLGHDRWARLDLWLLAYWLAFLINGSFDVFLEGPQGGIWFWSLYGFGLAALALQSRPPVLAPDPA